MQLVGGEWVPTAEDLVVVVEPLYGGVAVAASLDAGWSSVEVADATGGAPIPLVSFEQPVPRTPMQDAARCRVRSADLAAALDQLMGEDSTPVLAMPANARPAMSALARACASCDHVTFVPAGHAADSLTVDGMWATGMLIRILLEELDVERSVRLADAAGVAVTVAQGAEDPASQLSAGSRWRDHLAGGGHADDLRIASTVDSIGAVPIVTREGGTDALVATAWAGPPAT